MDQSCKIFNSGRGIKNLLSVSAVNKTETIYNRTYLIQPHTYIIIHMRMTCIFTCCLHTSPDDIEWIGCGLSQEARDRAITPPMHRAQGLVRPLCKQHYTIYHLRSECFVCVCVCVCGRGGGCRGARGALYSTIFCG